MLNAADGSAIALTSAAALAGLLLIAVGHDLKHRRIPNWVVFSGAVAALLAHALLPAGDGLFGAVPGGAGVLTSLAGLGVGLALLLPLYLVRAMGAGDVKLMAMVGAFVGPLDALAAVVCTFFAGALLALLVALRAGVLRQAAHNIRLIFYAVFARVVAAQGPAFDARTDSAAKLPYAVAIAAGTLAFLAIKQFA